MTNTNTSASTTGPVDERDPLRQAARLAVAIMTDEAMLPLDRAVAVKTAAAQLDKALANDTRGRAVRAFRDLLAVIRTTMKDEDALAQRVDRTLDFFPGPDMRPTPPPIASTLGSPSTRSTTGPTPAGAPAPGTRGKIVGGRLAGAVAAFVRASDVSPVVTVQMLEAKDDAAVDDLVMVAAGEWLPT